MSESKYTHTPGPYKWAPNVNCPAPQKGAFVYIEVEGERCVLAEVSARNVILQDICEANAALFAASPEMLAELRAIANRIDKGSGTASWSADEHTALVALLDKADPTAAR